MLGKGHIPQFNYQECPQYSFRRFFVQKNTGKTAGPGKVLTRIDRVCAGGQNIPGSAFEPFIKFLNALLFPLKSKTVLAGFADSLRAGM